MQAKRKRPGKGRVSTGGAPAVRCQCGLPGCRATADTALHSKCLEALEVNAAQTALEFADTDGVIEFEPTEIGVMDSFRKQPFTLIVKGARVTLMIPFRDSMQARRVACEIISRTEYTIVH